MTEQDKHKDKPLYLDPVKSLPLIGTIIAALVGGMALYDNFSPPSTSSVEYVLDTSRGMKGKLGKINKMQRVKEHILVQVARIPNDPAALRLAGGDGCAVDYKSPAVGFAEGNRDDFESALSEVTPAGKSNMANAISHAASDLLERNKEASHTSATVYVFMGSVADACARNPKEAIGDALSRLRAEESIEVDFQFVGVKPSKETRRFLKAISREAEGFGFESDVDYAKKARDLDPLPDSCDRPADVEYSTDCP